MRTELGENGPNSGSPNQILLNQLKEITGIQDPQVLYSALNASQGDVGQAVGLLTAQTAEVQNLQEPPEAGGSGDSWDAQKGISKDELQTAIALSLQESQHAQEEEREFHRALEVSAEENAARMKRKRCEGQGDVCSPADWIRQGDWPVGIRNVGNTCWFSAVIQSLFHLPVFRRLVLNYHLSERLLEKCKSQSDKRNVAFMQELRCLFALMVGSTRRFVDPSAAVELLRDAFRTNEAQQDVSEFSHKLLDWLEDAFQLSATGNNAEDKQKNPMVQLFYGTFVTERRQEGKTFCNTEQFGQYPLQVNGFNNLDECLEGAMVEKDIESLLSESSATSGRERWFKKLPPVLTFELSRFEFNTQLGRPEKIHKKLEFPQIIYMDRYLHKNIQKSHERRNEVKKLKEQLSLLQQKFECYKSYGSGPVKYPLADMLQFVLEFASTKPPASVSSAEDPRPTASSPTPANPSLSDSSVCSDGSEAVDAESAEVCQRTPIYKPFTQCRPPVEHWAQPAPHSVSEEELQCVKSCLQRWKSQVENDINELKASMDRLSQRLELMYADDTLCQVPYRLHAVLVHEGQASAGHYWAYIFDHQNQRWMKYNDIVITESSWEELERDSFGGMTNASAYCLMYINDRLPQLITEDTDDETGQVLLGIDSLPPVLRRYVQEDNSWFQQELSEWEEQFCQTATAAEEDPHPGPDRVEQTSAEPEPQSGPSNEAEPDLQVQPKEESQTTTEPEPAPETEQEPAPATELEPAPVPGQSSDCQPDSSNSISSASADPETQGPTLETDTEIKEQASSASASAVAAASPPPSSSSSSSSDLHQDQTDSGATGLTSEAPAELQVSTHAAEAEAEHQQHQQQQHRQQQQEEGVPVRPSPENEVSEVDIPSVGRITVRADADGYNEETMLTPAMQGVILAIAKARHTFDSEGPEAGLIKAFHEEYGRLYELSQDEATPQDDARLQHSLVYFFQNDAPKRVIERTLLEQFTDRNLCFDERGNNIRKEARAKLRLIQPEDMDMEEYEQWHDGYRLFRTVFVYLLTGLEHYQHGKLREALTYLAHAYETNESLLRNGEKRGVDQSLISIYRRKCLSALNESASRMFCSGEDAKVEEGVSIMDELVIPCLHLMSREAVLTQEDRDAVENIRSHWCCCLGQDINDSLQVKLGELLPRVLDGASETLVLKDPPTVQVNQAYDLCSRLAAVMKSIHNTSIVTVK